MDPVGGLRLTMKSRWILRVAAGCASILLARGTVHAAEEKMQEIKKIRSSQRSFLNNYLAPRMESRLAGQAQAADAYANPDANPWTRDHETVRRVESEAIRAGKKAIKKYLVDSLRIDTWSIPLFETGKRAGPGPVGVGGGMNGDSRARLRFGVSHLTPKAELTIPATYGRVAVGADARGAVNATYESHSYTFRVDVSYDSREHTGMFLLGRRF